jgi:tetratricopeptide (TPR) repeat protein
MGSYRRIGMAKSLTEHRGAEPSANYLGASILLALSVPLSLPVHAGIHLLAGTGHSVARHASDWEGQAGSLLVDYFRRFQEDKDVAAFRDRVSARYDEPTLDLILSESPLAAVRQAAVTAILITGTYERSNLPLGRALADSDRLVRSLAHDALWAIWFRADTPEHNRMLEQVIGLIRSDQLDRAETLVDRLIIEAPNFVEARNQRAIIYFAQGRLAESALECKRVVERNPFHVGAISGLAMCQLRLKQFHDYLKTMQRAAEIQPYDESLRITVKLVEAELAGLVGQEP